MRIIFRLFLLFCLWSSWSLAMQNEATQTQKTTILERNYTAELESRFFQEVYEKPAAQITNYFDEFIRKELEHLMQTNNLSVLFKSNQDLYPSLAKYKILLTLVDNKKQEYAYKEKINVQCLRNMLNRILFLDQ